jgi:hypothetical protein
MLADEGVDKLWQVTDIISWQASAGELYCTGDLDFLKYFKASFAKDGTLYPKCIHSLSGSSTTCGGISLGDYNFYLNDGTLVGLSRERGIIDNIDNTTYTVVIDVNGDKKLPNKYGRDIFNFRLQQNGTLIPVASKTDNEIYGNTYWRDNSYYCGTANSSTIPSNTSGSGCAARIIENGWKMDY